MSHQIIGIICYANSLNEARERAEEILNENLVGEYKPFDYGTFFDEESSVSGKSRWGNITPVCLADSKEGKKLINRGIKATKDNFMEMIKKIRKHLDFYSDEELFEEEVKDTKKKIILSLDDDKEDNNELKWLRQFKYYCYCLGEYRGTNIWLYDNDGEGIQNTKHLKDVLNKWKCLYEDEGKENPSKNLNIYIIPIDVHS